MRVSRSLWQRFLILFVVVLAACGSDDGTGNPSNDPPTASLRIPATAPIGSAVVLDGSGSGAAGGRTLTYAWALTSKPTGSTAAISNATIAQPTLTPDLAGVYSVTLTVNDGLKSTIVSGSTTAAVGGTLPSIVSNIVEPLSGIVSLGLSDNTGVNTITWLADGTTLGTSAATTQAWDTTALATGNHIVVAHILFLAGYSVDVTRTFSVRQSAISITNATITESAGSYSAIIGAASANGVLRVDATLDGVAIGTLAGPNTCRDSTGANCPTGLNSFAFAGTVANGSHVVVITVTDGIGNTLAIQLRMNVTDVT